MYGSYNNAIYRYTTAMSMQTNVCNSCFLYISEMKQNKNIITLHVQVNQLVSVWVIGWCGGHDPFKDKEVHLQFCKKIMNIKGHLRLDRSKAWDCNVLKLWKVWTLWRSRSFANRKNLVTLVLCWSEWNAISMVSIIRLQHYWIYH